MTAFTKVEYQNSTVALDDGTFQYIVTALVTEAGELPHTCLFVYQYTDIADALKDTFIRVATPYDLEHIPVGRDAAIAASNTYFLASYLTRKYTDLNTAVQAKEAVKSRINDGVKAWYDYDTDFSGNTDVYHPTADATYEQQLQDAYYAARTTRQEAETAVTDADDALSTARAISTAQSEVVAAYKTHLDYATTVREYWTKFKAATGTVSGTGTMGATNTYQVGPVAHMLHELLLSLNYETYKAAFDNETLALQTQSQNEFYIGQLDAILLQCYNDLSGKYSTAQAKVVINNNAVSAAVLAKKEAEATLASAQAAEDAALAAAVAICPTFVPTST